MQPIESINPALPCDGNVGNDCIQALGADWRMAGIYRCPGQRDEGPISWHFFWGAGEIRECKYTLLNKGHFILPFSKDD